MDERAPGARAPSVGEQCALAALTCSTGRDATVSTEPAARRRGISSGPCSWTRASRSAARPSAVSSRPHTWPTACGAALRPEGLE